MSQGSGTISRRPRAVCSGLVFEVYELTREQSWNPKRKKSPCSLTAPTSMPPPSRSVSISITSVSCAKFQSRGYLLRAFYYTAVIEDQEYSSIRPLIDWLDYNGYSVVTKATKEFVDQT